MSRFVILILLLAICGLAAGMTGCSPNINKYAEDGSFGVRLRDGVLTTTDDLYLGLTLKNLGSSAALYNFRANLLGSGGEYEARSIEFAATVRPKGQVSWDLWFRNLDDKNFPLDTEVTLAVFADDTAGNNFEVEFTLDSLRELSSPG